MKKLNGPAKEIIDLLKDSIRDVEILAEGRGGWERCHAINGNLFKVFELLEAYNPYRKDTEKAEEKPQPRVAVNPFHEQGWRDWNSPAIYLTAYSGGSTMRKCPFDGCDEEVPESVFACDQHWGTLNREQQRKIWNAHRLRREGKISVEEQRREQREVLAEAQGKSPLKKLADMTEPELASYFTNLACVIESRLPPGPSPRGKCLFFLIVADGSEPGIAQYVGNSQCEGAIRLLRETADRLERNEDVKR